MIKSSSTKKVFLAKHGVIDMQESAVDLEQPVICIKFKCMRVKQRFLIAALLRYSRFDIDTAASIINVPTHLLEDVYHGKCFLTGNPSKKLARLFLLCFSD